MECFKNTKLIAIMVLLCSFSSFAEEENTPFLEPYRGHQSYTAVIDDVIDITYHDFRSIHYLVTWKGQQIVVKNPNLHVKKKKGDQLTFLVMWYNLEKENETIKNLAFTALN